VPVGLGVAVGILLLALNAAPADRGPGFRKPLAGAAAAGTAVAVDEPAPDRSEPLSRVRPTADSSSVSDRSSRRAPASDEPAAQDDPSGPPSTGEGSSGAQPPVSVTVPGVGTVTLPGPEITPPELPALPAPPVEGALQP